MTESDHHFDKLEEKLAKVVDLFKRTHAQNCALQQQVEELQEELKDRPKRLEALERDVQVLQREREDVRTRIEKLIQQIESLTNAGPEG